MQARSGWMPPSLVLSHSGLLPLSVTTHVIYFYCHQFFSDPRSVASFSLFYILLSPTTNFGQTLPSLFRRAERGAQLLLSSLHGEMSLRHLGVFCQHSTDDRFVLYAISVSQRFSFARDNIAIPSDTACSSSEPTESLEKIKLINHYYDRGSEPDRWRIGYTLALVFGRRWTRFIAPLWGTLDSRYTTISRNWSDP